MRRRARIWLIAALLVILGGLFSVVGLMSGRARSAKRIVMDRWAATVGAPEEVLGRYPKRETNDPARELVEAAASLGLEIAPRDDEDLPRPSRQLSKRFARYRAQSAGWLKKQLSLGDGGTETPPPEVRQFLWDFREPLDRMERLLVSGEPLSWTMDVERLWNAPMPNLRGHVDLTKLLLADAFFQLDGLGMEGAERALEATWNLSESLDGDPTLIVQITRLNMVRMQAAAVRQMPWLDHWIPRLDAQRYREPFERALFHEGWVWPQIDFRSGPEDGIVDRVHSIFYGPYMEIATADTSERWRRKIVRLQDSETWCRGDLAAEGIRLDLPMPWWNRWGDMLARDPARTLGQLVPVQQQVEFSRKVLEIGAMRRDTGRWPELDEVWLESGVCRSNHWVYEPDGENVVLRLDPVPSNPRDQHVPVTWSFSLAPHGFDPEIACP